MLSANGKFLRAWLDLVALVLAMRLLIPTGFMPVFEHGTVAVVACPDFAPPSAVSGSHTHHGKKDRWACPYAAAASPIAFSAASSVNAEPMVLADAPAPGHSFSFLERYRGHDRPPSRGPPLQA